MDEFKRELSLNAEKVTAVIKNDAFPDKIEPDFLKEAVRDYPLQGGKRIRSALLSWSCGALGGNPVSARFAAAAVEIYHNWTLVHDDIIDDDPMRRNAPATHAKLAESLAGESNANTKTAKKFGRDFAILAGDIQQGWAAATLLKSMEAGISKEAVLLLSKLLHSEVTVPLISGEALDVEFSHPRPTPPTSEEVERMLSLKTGALLRFCAIAGAVIAIDTSPQGEELRKSNYDSILSDARVAALAEFAGTAGTAFQLRDDWLGVFGDEKTVGKPICSDISEAKPTILLLETISSLNGDELKSFRSFVGRKSLSLSEIDEIRRLTEKSGAADRVNKKALTLLDDAKTRLNAITASRFKNLLHRWVDFLIDRKY
ncbi:MAG: polyprenyl synthetase family protein [Kiritimatiellaeota bacterium]|nr:polyprenyl synthetase family protein [Kiritimatiellota bacterium]